MTTLTLELNYLSHRLDCLWTKTANVSRKIFNSLILDNRFTKYYLKTFSAMKLIFLLTMCLNVNNDSIISNYTTWQHHILAKASHHSISDK